MNRDYPGIVQRYHSLPAKENYVMLRHVWLDGNGKHLRSKSNYQETPPKRVEELPLWGYCGQTCGHMKLTANSDCWLKPVLLCNDPFREHDHKMVLCVPVKYEIEVNRVTGKPLGWPFDDFDSPTLPSKYGVGANRVAGRDINEAFYRACLYAGLDISGSQVEDLPSMFSFDLGPGDGLNIGDQLWMARYILHYIGEQYDCVISFDPLKHKQRVNHSIKVWSEDELKDSKHFDMNCDPYIAVKQYYQE